MNTTALTTQHRASMSSIKTFQECERRYYYDYVIGLKPKVVRPNMQAGTDIHDLLQAGYEMWEYDQGESFLSIVAAHWFDRYGSIEENPDKWILFEVVEYYWENVGRFDKFDSIILVETPVTVVYKNWSIRATFDLLARIDGRLSLWDHKTTGTVDDEINFMPLDFQLRFYDFCVDVLHSEPVDMLHNIIRREVPRELTKSGRKSTASKDVNAYLRRNPVVFSKEARVQSRREIALWLSKMERSHKTGEFSRSPKKGFMGCGGCVYRTICEAEYSGRTLDVNNIGVKMQFRVAEDKLAKI